MKKCFFNSGSKTYLSSCFHPNFIISNYKLLKYIYCHYFGIGGLVVVLPPDHNYFPDERVLKTE